MESKILTDQEKQKIEVMVNGLLKSVGGKMNISEHHTTQSWTMSSTEYGVEKRIEWKEYVYRVFLTKDHVSHEYPESFDASSFENNETIAKVAWRLAYDFWNHFDKDLNSELGNTLWPPNYQKIITDADKQGV